MKGSGGTPFDESPFAALLDAIEVPAFVVDSTGSLTFRNRLWDQQFDFAEAKAWSFMSVVSPSDRERLKSALLGVMQNERPSLIDFTAYRQSGDAASLSCAASPFVPNTAGDVYAVCVCWDLTDQRRQEERLAFMAGHDPLTGLSNRRAFEEALARAASKATRGSNAALLMMDMDNLKQFNDTRGHLEGDQALVNLSLLLRRHVRAGDLPARIGGDEFAVLLDDTTMDEAVEIAERIRAAAASREFVTGARSSMLSVSGGIARVEAGVDVRVLLDRADAALYAAKHRGRDLIVEWTPAISASAAPEWLTQRVRDAFLDDGFVLLFQPVVRLSDGGVAYHESLLRLRSPEGPLLGPAEFLPVVERLGLMGRLTRRVVDLALWQLATISGACISVNLSSSDIGNEELLTEIEDSLKGAETARGRLLFELSEQTLLSNLAGSRVWMNRLAKVGCRFVLDRFGTGAGMFVLLREEHIEQVKLSHTVMKAMAAESSNLAFVSALRELIESQGKFAVAGFLETDELLKDVAKAGFTWGQGHKLQEPSADLAALVAHARMISTDDPLSCD